MSGGAINGHLERIRRVTDAERARLAALVPRVERTRAHPAPPTLGRPALRATAGGMLSRSDAADLLGVSVRSLDRMRARGELAAVELSLIHI